MEMTPGHPAHGLGSKSALAPVLGCCVLHRRRQHAGQDGAALEMLPFETELNRELGSWSWLPNTLSLLFVQNNNNNDQAPLRYSWIFRLQSASFQNVQVF